MDPIRLLVYFLALIAFLLLLRRLSSGPGSDSYSLPASGLLPPDDVTEDSRMQPALTGADLPFPIALPAVERNSLGKYNRPIVRNYYFSRLDLVKGPDDPSSFCDEFIVELENPRNRHVWNVEYTVATPAGLQQMLQSGRDSHLILPGATVIVGKWDLPSILRVTLDDYIEKVAWQDEEDTPDNT